MAEHHDDQRMLALVGDQVVEFPGGIEVQPNGMVLFAPGSLIRFLENVARVLLRDVLDLFSIVFAFRDAQGWQMFRVPPHVGKSSSYDSPQPTYPLPSPDLFPQLGSMLVEEPGILADWYDEHGEYEAAKQLRAPAKRRTSR